MKSRRLFLKPRPVLLLRAAFALMLLIAGVTTQAEVRPSRVFSSHMVLQQQKPLQFWGWAKPTEKITVQILTNKVVVEANAKGEWKATLPEMKAGGPYTVIITGSNTVTYEDVMVGEVWLCSGQSNMEMGVPNVLNGEAEVAAANYPGIRLLKVPKRMSPEPKDDLPDADFEAGWKLCTPKTICEGGWGGFSATAYFYARELHKQLGVTIGLIDSSWGATHIETWTAPEGFAAVASMTKELEFVKQGDPRSDLHKTRLKDTIQATEKWVASAKEALATEAPVPTMPLYPENLLPPHDLQDPTAIYNGMIHCLSPYAIRGVIWYQGEGNNEGMLYTDRMQALIEGWRKVWNQGDFSFYYVQVAPWRYDLKPQVIAELWEAQAAVEKKIPNTGMAVINDIGDLGDIHPKNKQEVGRRLALLALAHDYNQTHLVCSGPTYKGMKIDANKLRITFDSVGTGLASRDGKPLNWFEIVDARGGGFVSATAQIEGDSVVLSAPSVSHPVAMRFAWSMLAEPNLMNEEGLPAGAFRAGVAPKHDLLNKNVSEIKDFQLVYDLDLSKLSREIKYEVDNHGKINEPFDRIAYFMELENNGGAFEYVFVSMDAFTTDLGKIGVPTVAAHACFQQNVSNLNVVSNVKGIVCGTNLTGGNIEFWPNNYGQKNQGIAPNASSKQYDFDDTMNEPPDGYGSMQVHNHDVSQTLFAINNWRGGENADIGIGNCIEKEPDWTFAGNCKNYESKRLRVFVRIKK